MVVIWSCFCWTREVLEFFWWTQELMFLEVLGLLDQRFEGS